MIKIGFVGFGEINTPRELIERKVSKAKAALQEAGFSMVDGGVVSDDIPRQEAVLALDKLKAESFDVLVLCIAGWIPSYTVIRLADNFKHLPMVLWGLTGEMENGRLVTTADQAGTSALRRPMEELGFRFGYFYDTIDGGSAVAEISSYIRCAAAEKSLMTAKIGMMGYRDMNLYGTMFDGVSLKEKTGIEIEFFDMLELANRAAEIDPVEQEALLAKIKKEWTFAAPAEDSTLRQGIAYYLALRDIAAEKGYSGFSLNDVDGMKKHLNFPPSMIFMLLANELGLCTTPENDSLGSAMQLIAKALTGQIGMYLEFYEYMQDRVLMGVPDYVPLECVEGDYTVLPTKFGLLDSCILNISKLKTGTVTLARLYKTREGYGIHAALAEAVPPRSWEEAGWMPPAPQLPSLEMVLGDRTSLFTHNIMSQHYIVTYGDHLKLYRNYAELNDLTFLQT